MYFLFLSSFLTNSERSGEFEENGDEKKNHACVNGVSPPACPGFRGLATRPKTTAKKTPIACGWTRVGVRFAATCASAPLKRVAAYPFAARPAASPRRRWRPSPRSNARRTADSAKRPFAKRVEGVEGSPRVSRDTLHLLVV